MSENLVHLARPRQPVGTIELGDPAADMCDSLRRLEKLALLLECGLGARRALARDFEGGRQPRDLVVSGG